MERLRIGGVPGALVLKPKIHEDHRGGFTEVFPSDAFGGDTRIAQVNVSVSRCDVLRGLHFSGKPQAKLVTCLRGWVEDVMVDLKTLDWAVVELSEQDNHVVYIPSGFAHGFLSKSDGATVVYALSSPYDPANDHSLYAFDPEIGIGWGVPAGRVIMSERDEAALTVREARRKKLIP